MLSRKQIKKLLDERRKDKVNIAATLDAENVKTLKQLARVHNISFSAMIEICIEVGLADPYINPKEKEEEPKGDNL